MNGNKILCFNLATVDFKILISEDKLFNRYKFIFRDHLIKKKDNANICNITSDVNEKSFIVNSTEFINRMCLFRGCCIKYKNRVILIIGPPYSGKTNFLFYMLNKGGKLITDDLTVIEKTNCKIHTIKKPVCLRTSLIKRLRISKKYLQEKNIDFIYLRDNYDDKMIVHPFDVVLGEYVEGASVITDIYIVSDDIDINIYDAMMRYCLKFDLECFKVINKLINKCNIKIISKNQLQDKKLEVE